MGKNTIEGKQKYLPERCIRVSVHGTEIGSDLKSLLKRRVGPASKAYQEPGLGRLAMILSRLIQQSGR